MGGKSKKQTVGYKYYLGQQLVLCHGPIDVITRATVDDRIAWEGASTGGQITINKPSLFGGDKREGGVSGVVDIEMGRDTQGKNSYLLSKIGSLIPAYRGVVQAVFRQCYLGNNPYLKAWRFRGQRIFTRQNGIDQWYPEKAEVPDLGGTGTGGVEVLLNADTAIPANNSTTDGLTGGITFTLGLGESLRIKKVPGLTYDAWSYTPFDGYPGFPGDWRADFSLRDADGNITHHWGSPAVTYEGQAAAYAAMLAFGEETVSGSSSYTIFPYDAAVNDNRAGLSVQVYKVLSNGSGDMNPAHIIRECLTDPDWGMGYLDSDIDDDSFMAAADQLYTEGLGMSLLWDREITIEAFIQEIIKHIDAALYVSRATGKFVLKLIRQDYDEESLILLDESNISRVEDPIKSAFGELTTTVTVKYWDANTGKDASLTVFDSPLAISQGGEVPATMQYPGFTNARTATIAAQRDLRTLSSPLLRCTIYADSDAKPLNVGDAFKFSWSRWGIADMVMRVTGIALGTGRSNQIRISASQDIFDTDTTTIISVPGSGWVDPTAPPSAVPFQMATEAPYFELVQTLGQATVDANLAAKPDSGYVIAAGARAPSAINARLWSDSGTGYEDTGVLDFSPFATLVAAITKTQTAFVVEDMDDLEEVVIGTHVQVGGELMRVDSVDAMTGAITVGRGVLDTIPDAHAAGTPLFFWDQYAGFDPTEYVLGEEIDVKITPISGAGELALADATAMMVTLDQRAWRPYAPGDLRIETESYGEGPYEDELSIEWAHRDRIQQTAGTLIDHTAGDIGPEAGTTYRLRGYLDGALIHTEDDIAGNSTTWTPGSEGLVKIEVHAKRDGVYSWQAPYHEFYYTSGSIRFTEAGDTRFTEEGELRVTED